MSAIEGKLCIVVSNNGGPDTIYIGYVHREDDLLILTTASMIVRYEDVGQAGLSHSPQGATRLRHASEEVALNMINVIAIIRASEMEWRGHLGISRG